MNNKSPVGLDEVTKPYPSHRGFIAKKVTKTCPCSGSLRHHLVVLYSLSDLLTSSLECLAVARTGYSSIYLGREVVLGLSEALTVSGEGLNIPTVVGMGNAG